MIILGIDPGTAIMGYGAVDCDRGQLQVMDYGCFKTEKGLLMADRLVYLGDKVVSLIQDIQPDVLAIEELFFFKNNKTVISVGQARGMVMFLGRKAGVEVREYTPLQVKQAVTGYGRADKKQVQIMVKEILKLSIIPKPDDVADALAVAICCSSSIKFEHKIENVC